MHFPGQTNQMAHHPPACNLMFQKTQAKIWICEKNLLYLYRKIWQSRNLSLHLIYNQTQTIMDNVLTYRQENVDLKGKRVKCIKMNDPEPIEPNEMGTIDTVDDMGTIHVVWDNGRRLGLVREEDQYELI